MLEWTKVRTSIPKTQQNTSSLDLWRMRSLSLGEKIIIYKSLAISEITYLYLSPRNPGRTNISSKKGRHLKFHSKLHFNDNIAKYFPSFYKIMFHNCRSSLQRCSVRKGVFTNFAKFKGKYLCQSLFFNKAADLSLQLY